MPLLSTEPPEPVRSLEELFAIASAMEAEAETRYAEIAARLRAEGMPALAAVFERLSADERQHLGSVVAWSQARSGRPPDPALIRWRMPETFDDEGLAAVSPELLTAYRSLAMAVRNEERAFAFWAYVAAQAPSAEIRLAAEALAREELGHVATLRAERRRAFHRARPANAGSAPLGAAALERRMAALMEPIAAARRDRRLHAAVEGTRALADELERAPVALPGGDAPAPDGVLALAEFLADRYLDAAESAVDPDALARLQRLAGHAVERLAWLRADLPEIAAS